jgi:hypothetical protein
MFDIDDSSNVLDTSLSYSENNNQLIPINTMIIHESNTHAISHSVNKANNSSNIKDKNKSYNWNKNLKSSSSYKPYKSTSKHKNKFIDDKDKHSNETSFIKKNKLNEPSFSEENKLKKPRFTEENKLKKPSFTEENKLKQDDLLNIFSGKDSISDNVTDITDDNDDFSVKFDDQEDDPFKDSGIVLVIILQCETKACNMNINNLKMLFSDPYFIVQVCSVDPPHNMPVIKNLTSSQYLENYYIRKALNYAAEGPYARDINGNIQSNRWWGDIPCIIVKDSSVSNINQYDGMKKRIKVALESAKEADLHFLCKWQDNCNKFTDIKGASNIENGSCLKWTTKPTSSQAVMYTPKSRDFIRNKLMYSTIPMGDLLNSYIAKGSLSATAFVPNIIDYDINLSTDESDYAKLSECNVEPSTSSQTSTQQWIWLLILILILVTLVVILTIFTARRSIAAPKING